MLPPLVAVSGVGASHPVGIQRELVSEAICVILLASPWYTRHRQLATTCTQEYRQLFTIRLSARSIPSHWILDRHWKAVSPAALIAPRTSLHYVEPPSSEPFQALSCAFSVFSQHECACRETCLRRHCWAPRWIMDACVAVLCSVLAAFLDFRVLEVLSMNPQSEFPLSGKR